MLLLLPGSHYLTEHRNLSTIWHHPIPSQLFFILSLHLIWYSIYVNPLPGVGAMTVFVMVLPTPAIVVVETPEMLGLMGLGRDLGDTTVPREDMLTLMGMN